MSILAAIAAGCDEPATTESTLESTSTGSRAVVERINDGDTLTLRGGEKVRLVQIDAPELTSDCYGLQARATLARLVRPGAWVSLVTDPALDRRDTYGRLLRYVFVGSRNVNLELVRRGAAVPYFFRKERGRHAAALITATAAAQQEHRGLWGACPAARFDPYRGSLTGQR